MGEWSLNRAQITKGEALARIEVARRKAERQKLYTKISQDLRQIKTEINDKGDLILGIPSGKRVKVTRENAIKFAKWILEVTKGK